jgi:hypothetical protein
MKSHRLLLCLILAASPLTAEEITEYRCVNSHSVAKSEKDSNDHINYSSVGEELSKLETGKESLLSIYEARKKDSGKGEPFYGPVEKYIFKDTKGRHYLAHFEFKDGDEFFGRGDRFAILPLTKVEGQKDKYSGSPYNGRTIYDEGILK